MTKKLDIGKLGPVLIAFIVLVVGAMLGYAWGASAVQIVDTGIWQLEVSYQSIYLQAVADAYAADGNDALAIERLSFFCQENGGLEAAFAQAEQRYGQRNPQMQANLDQLRTLVESGEVQQNPNVGVCNYKAINPFAKAFRLAAPLLLLLMAIGIVGYGIWIIIQESEEEAEEKGEEAKAPATAAKPGEAAPTAAKPEEKKEEAPARPRAVLPGFGRRKKKASEDTVLSAAARGARISATVEKTDYAAMGNPPLVQFMTTYLHGDDLYDDSFSIETPSGEFLGETGVGISDTIGSGEAKNVTAFEVWLFDKNDIRTVTKVLMSDHAFNDDAIRAKLAPKGEAVLAKPGEIITLETATLRVQARIVDMEYGSGPLPPNSYFERITIELAAWKREGQPSAQPGRSSGPTPRGKLPEAPGGTPPTGLPPLSDS
ncbi:MAG TPA: hypothetical protein ENI95_05010 [Chloroflexi bacterium]|nr:hypothetical protein [Chloroflexota bacterium]